MSTRAVTAYAALGTALLYLISVPIGSFADAPEIGASGAAVLSFFAAHRSGVLAASVLNGIAWCALMPLTFAGLWQLLRARAGTASAVALICAAVESALIGVALVFGIVGAYESPQLAPGIARVFGDAFNLATSASAWPTVPCALALAFAWRAYDRSTRVVPGLALLAAALHTIASVGFARSGTLSPSSIPALAPISFALLMAAIGVTLLRRAPLAASTGEAATAAAVSA